MKSEITKALQEMVGHGTDAEKVRAEAATNPQEYLRRYNLTLIELQAFIVCLQTTTSIANLAQCLVNKRVV